MIKATATINDKEYNIPMSYSEITLGKFKAIQDFLYSDYNKDKTDQIVSGKIKDEEEILIFMLDFINYVTDIPSRELKVMNRFASEQTREDELVECGIEELFYHLGYLFTVPTIENPVPAKQLGNYHFIDKIDLTQAILKELNFIEYTEAQAVIKAFNKLEAGRYENLNILMAIMYRPLIKNGIFTKDKIEEYDYETVHERAKEFDALDMETVWNCLFFFTLLKKESLQSISKSLEVEVEKAQADSKG